MQIKAIKKAVVVAVTALSAWLSVPNRAEASSFVNPFSEDANGYISTYYDGTWVAWIPKSGDCSNVVWQYVADINGFTENVYLTSTGYNDNLTEIGGVYLCGYNNDLPPHNGWGLYIMGNGGNDGMMGRDSLTYMYGGDGNDLLDSLDSASWFFGQNGDDTMKSCDSNKSSENYNGGSGNDRSCDASGSWAYNGSDVETKINCWNAQGANICQ